MLRAGLVIVGMALVAALVGPWVTPIDPSSQELALRLAAPSARHLFGMDELGRDILARVLAGARISFLVGLTVVSVSAVVGTLLGTIAGYYGGLFDEIVSRAVDVLLAFPGLLLAIALVAVLGPSVWNVLFALSLTGWVSYARLVRGQVLRACRFEYVEAAKALGAGSSRVLWSHVIPAAVPVLVVHATSGMAGAIISEASLSFLGLGVQPPSPSWGAMLNGGRAHILDAPHLTIIPGLAIATLVFGFNALGDGLRDRLDPRRDA